MRIAHVLAGRCNPDSANGVDKTVYYLARTQARLDHTVGVFSVTEKEPIPIEGVDVRAYAPTGRGFLALLRLPPKMKDQLLAWKPDWVHFHFVHVPVHVRLAAVLGHVGYSVTPNGGLHPRALSRRRWKKLAFALLVERRYFQRARFVHAVSRWDEEGLRTYGVHVPVVRAPNCLDLGSVPVGRRTEFLRERFPSTRGRRVFLFLGRLDPEHKGLDLLVAAFAVLRRKDVALVLAGPDWRGSRARLERDVSRLGLQDTVLFAGALHGREKWEALASADVFAHPSRWEAGVPFSVLEAMAVGLPCLVTRAVDPDGLLEAAGAALVTEPRTSSVGEALAEFAEMADGELRRIGESARVLVERHFNWERTAKVLLDAYERYR